MIVTQIPNQMPIDYQLIENWFQYQLPIQI